MLKTEIGNIKVTERVQRLKKRILDQNPKICVERALYVTRSYRENENVPIVLRRARGLENTLHNMSIFILDDETIVGNQISGIRGVPVFPEMSCTWLKNEMHDFSSRPEKFSISEEDARILSKEIIPYWKGRAVEDLIFGAFTEEQVRALHADVFNVGLHLSKGIGHFLLDYGLVLDRGIDYLLEYTGRIKKTLDPSEHPDDIEKYHFLSAVEIVYRAFIRFAERYAALAETLAQEQTDRVRKRELLEVAEICARVPAQPAASFREAIQAFWFTQLVPHIDSDGTAISPGRFDVYLWPFLKKDLESGSISMHEAQDVIDQLWLKFNQILSLWKADDAKYFGGFPISQNLIVGGIDRECADVTNPLSYLCLNAIRRLLLPQPALSVRLHKNTPAEFLDAVNDVIATGVGMPAVFNDEMIIPALINRGIPIDDAREYAIIGCVEPGFQGKGCCVSNAAYFNLLKCLELALGNGTCLLTGEVIGPETGDPDSFSDVDDLLKAFEEQISYWVRQMAGVFNVVELVHMQHVPFPFNSALVSNCLETATDYLSGGACYNLNGVQGVGIANVADSLSAVQQLVFEEKRLDLREFVQVLQSDFKDREVLRQYIINRTHRYGNDEDKVDCFAKRVALIYCREVEKYQSTRGGRYHPGLYPVSANIPLGRDVGASADGRMSRQPLADGIAPSHGSDKKGPTAVLLSVSKLDQIYASNGTQLNQKFAPFIFRSDRDRQKFSQYLRTFINLPMMEVQFNVVKKETLQDAQKHPDRHRNLVVRVAGYSAFFNDLDRSTQDDIIGRTEQAI